MVHVMMVIIARVVVTRQVQIRVIHVTVSVIALSCSQYDQPKQTCSHLKHSCQIVVVVYWQQIAIFVCVKYVELDAVDAVQSFD